MAALPEPEVSLKRELALALEGRQDRHQRAHLGASILGRPCARALWYGFRWCTEIGFEGRILRLFERGHVEEELLAGEMRGAGLELTTGDPETGEQYRFSDIGGHVGGSMDGAVLGIPEAPKAWHVWECKTHNDKSFKKLEKEGVQAAKPEHYAQMLLYMEWSGMDRALYTAINKNDSDLYIERVKADPVEARKLIEKARMVVYSAEPPPRVTDKGPSYYLCKWCDHAPVCHQERLPTANCRTCLHSTPEMDGEARWSCAYADPDAAIPVEVQRTGCDEHVYIPGVTPWNAVDSSDSQGWVEYELADGRIKNGRKGAGVIPSRELWAMQKHTGSVDVAFDPAVVALRDQFDAEVIE